MDGHSIHLSSHNSKSAAVKRQQFTRRVDTRRPVILTNESLTAVPTEAVTVEVHGVSICPLVRLEIDIYVDMENSRNSSMALTMTDGTSV